MPKAGKGDELIETYIEIAAALTVALGGPALSADSAYRLSTRKHDPLPVEGYAGRSWIRRAVLEDWAERNRLKVRQRDEGAQIALPFVAPQKPR